LAYLWARVVKCEAAGCGATIPLVRNLWLSQARGRKKALRILYPKDGLEPYVEVYEPFSDKEVGSGTVARFKASCLKCHRVTPRERVQAQLRSRRGGADDAIILAVVRQNPTGRGKDYYTPAKADLDACTK